MQPHGFTAHAERWLTHWLYAPLSKGSVLRNPLRKDNAGILPFRQKPVCALLIREYKERNGASINAGAGLFEVCGVREKEMSPPFKTEMNVLSSTAKQSILSVHLDGVAANIAEALIALRHI